MKMTFFAASEDGM